MLCSALSNQESYCGFRVPRRFPVSAQPSLSAEVHSMIHGSSPSTESNAIKTDYGRPVNPGNARYADDQIAMVETPASDDPSYQVHDRDRLGWKLPTPDFEGATVRSFIAQASCKASGKATL
ncbi:unnamed protein product [Echinostoma caproni]|uniref:Uncharacterized protein n=1 Tax=Echinostoma caproni TaxID=27848 RepID=A0A183B5S3_9TREM|nr:unnamed protein product [Echinostoma caproni]